ncbi:uncharacterized protein F5147DRAFT_649923 [Suillus discolor]|uniref:Uncharacterized protein n=1 Tax=Suillus discolor TaxID=1912936 RepID=A0A9P7FFJ0_9AGAM|nr:uncharacterized protein F5147DRAFT_649923 [Suillus discolor]KAG2114774.1 hypothetical protein F5147DRAFT_649923 [Suillus discolor]
MCGSDMDVTFTGDTDVLKQQFSGHFKTVINVHGLEDVPMVVPNVRDVDGSLIHPSEYSKGLDKGTPVVVEVLLQLWTFGPENKHLDRFAHIPDYFEVAAHSAVDREAEDFIAQ